MHCVQSWSTSTTVVEDRHFLKYCFFTCAAAWRYECTALPAAARHSAPAESRIGSPTRCGAAVRLGFVTTVRGSHADAGCSRVVTAVWLHSHWGLNRSPKNLGPFFPSFFRSKIKKKERNKITKLNGGRAFKIRRRGGRCRKIPRNSNTLEKERGGKIKNGGIIELSAIASGWLRGERR